MEQRLRIVCDDYTFQLTKRYIDAAQSMASMPIVQCCRLALREPLNPLIEVHTGLDILYSFRFSFVGAVWQHCKPRSQALSTIFIQRNHSHTH